MSRKELLARLEEAPRLSPFLVLGDPTPELSIELARAAVAAGAGMIEIGFPYGDPVADGPAIQAACRRALLAGTSTSKAIELLARIHDAVPDTPLNLLVYGNLVHRRGLDRFVREVAGAGASSLLVPDVPLEENAPLRRVCREGKIAHVELVGPLTAPERLSRIDRAASGFLYLVAHQGITGVRGGGFEPVRELVARTVSRVRNPVCLGFGLSKREQIESAFEAGARLAVVGSHLASRIGAAWEGGGKGAAERVVSAFRSAVLALIPALREGRV
jgi:tryptophan synthase alpha chain